MLIHESPRQAEVFVDEISNVYRYLLRANDQELTTLYRELQFIKSYFQLLKPAMVTVSICGFWWLKDTLNIKCRP